MMSNKNKTKFFDVGSGNILKILEESYDFFEDLCDGNIKNTWDNKEIMINLIKNDGMLLELGSDEIRKDFDICFLAISQNLKASKFIDKSVKNMVMDKYIKDIKSYNLKEKSKVFNCRDEIFSKNDLDKDDARPIKKIRTFERHLNNLGSNTSCPSC